MVTVALGTTAPVGSVTVPVMTPCTVCDQTAPPLARTSRATAKIAKVRSLILSPLSKAFSAKASESNLELSFCSKPQIATPPRSTWNAGQTPQFCAIQLLIGRKVKNKLESWARRNLYQRQLGLT